MVDWSVPLKLGLGGLGAVMLCTAWFVARAVLHQGVPRPWLVGLGILFLVSVFTTVDSQVQVTVVSNLSSGNSDDSDGE